MIFDVGNLAFSVKASEAATPELTPTVATSSVTSSETIGPVIPSLASRGSRLEPIRGIVPDALDLPPGCRFAPRCPHAMPRCTQEAPTPNAVGPDHQAACWLYGSEGGADRAFE